MTLSIDGISSILTSTIGFLQVDAPSAVERYLAWQTPIKRAAGRTLVGETIAGDLRSALTRMVPLRRGEPSRMLFAPTTGAWTAYFDNLHTGADVVPIVRQLALELGCLGVRATAVPQTRTGKDGAPTERFGAMVMEIIDPVNGKPPLRYLRSIAAVNDGGRWRFDGNGPVQAFEKVDRYASRRIQDRLLPDLLADYLRALGIDAFNSEFYCPAHHSVLVTETFPDDDPSKYA